MVEVCDCGMGFWELDLYLDKVFGGNGVVLIIDERLSSIVILCMKGLGTGTI